MIFRVEKTQNYTVMSNYHFREQEMSLKAKGLLSLMLSLPDSWDYSIKGLCAICKENETAIRTALKELQKFGYLHIKKLTPAETDSGRFEYEYIVYEKPQRFEDAQQQDEEKQGAENLYLENQVQLNTNRSSINKLNRYIVQEELSQNNALCTMVIGYLNKKTGRRYRATNKCRSLINARIKEGATLEDFYEVIDKKSQEWLNDANMNLYLRPETLFGTKFQGYLNQTVTSKNPFIDILKGGAE